MADAAEGEALYRRLGEDEARARSRIDESDPALAQQAAAFLFREARLLDQRRYREWLELVADDCIYWIPSSLDGLDPSAESGHNFDDRRRLVDRVTLIETGFLHAQTPPSCTCRLISNIEAWKGQTGDLEVRSNIVIWEHRRGRTSAFIGRQEHQLAGGGTNRPMKKKVIVLINRDEPLGNVTFIL